jgi:ubiquinone/menaquinone biosynthesis C-methylase UbiE
VRGARQGRIPVVADDEITREMMAYYDERAEKYDEIYLGKGHATIDPDVYERDVATVSEMASGFGEGHLIDVGCGAGFWLPCYARNCSRITLIDQSERMLSKCRERVEELGLAHMASLVQGDFLGVELEASEYDCAFVGFLLSHLTSEQEKAFFGKLEGILKDHAQVMLVDSAWNWRRQRYRGKEGVQERVLNDGRLFRVYKRYFDKSDVEEMLERHHFEGLSYYTGEALIAAVAESHW